MMTDPIADMLTRIRNAQIVRKRVVDVPFSKMKMRIAEVLRSEGYIQGFEKKEGTPTVLSVELKYEGRLPAIQSITRESKPGHRKYRGADELPTVLNGYGIAIVSTSQGVMSNREAKKLGIGGEVICSIY